MVQSGFFASEEATVNLPVVPLRLRRPSGKGCNLNERNKVAAQLAGVLRILTSNQYDRFFGKETVCRDYTSP